MKLTNMHSNAISPSNDSRENDRIFSVAFDEVRSARARLVNVRPHRAITPLTVTPYLLAQAILLPLILCLLLYFGKPLLLDFWRGCVLFWSGLLDLNFGLALQLNDAGQQALMLPGREQEAPMPSPITMLVTAAIALAIFALSFGMKHAKLPLKFPLRIISVVQLVAVAYFWLRPGDFPYSISRHSEDLMTIGYVLMLATPVMLAIGYYILNQSLSIKLLHTALILLFMTVMVPHQVLVQAFIMQHLSVLFMPVLYLCFGAVFDALVFVALYSWAVSTAPVNATV